MAKIIELSVPERILAVEEIWDSITARPDSIPVTREQKKELDQRLKNFASDPDQGSSWSAVRRRVEKQSRK